MDKSREPTGKKMVKGGAWVLASRIIVAISQVLILGLLARMISPDEMGVYFLITNFVIIGSTLVQMGVPQVVVKRVAETLEVQARGEVRAMVQSCLVLSLFASCIFFVVLAFGVGEWIAIHFFESPLMASVILLVACWLVVQALQRTVGDAFRGLHDLKTSAIFTGAFSGMLTAIVLTLVYFVSGRSTLEYAVWISMLALVVSLLVALVLLHRRLNLLRFEKPLTFKPIFLLAIPILFASLSNVILNRADLWVLGMFVTERELALYGAAARIVSLLGTPLLIAVAITAPRIAQLNARGDKAGLERIVQLVPSMIALPSFFVIALILLWGDWLLQLIYGDPFYLQAASVLTYLALGQVACLIAGVSMQILIMTQEQKTVLVVTFLCAALTVLAAVLVVNDHGINGVAIAFAIGTATQAVMCGCVCIIKLKINPFFSPFVLANVKNFIGILKGGPGRQGNPKSGEAKNPL